MTRDVAVVRATGAVCAVGIGTAQTAASVRAGIARFEESRLLNERLDPYTLASVPDEALEPLAGALAGDPALSPRLSRLVRLAAPALREAAGRAADPGPIFLGLPADCAGREEALLGWLARQSGVPIDVRLARVFPSGRAAGLLALQAAVSHVAAGPARYAVVGGLDSHLDQDVLDALDRARRVLAPDVADGFIPGEGAAFALLGSPPAEVREAAGLVAVSAVATGEEAGHLLSDEPCRGDGLSDVLGRVADGLGAGAGPARTVFAGLNGESFWAKEWGVATLRVHRLFADDLRVEHPVDCFGDPGAALGPLMLAVIAAGLTRGWLRGPAVVWCASDGPERAAAVLRLAP